MATIVLKVGYTLLKVGYKLATHCLMLATIVLAENPLFSKTMAELMPRMICDVTEFSSRSELGNSSTSQAIVSENKGFSARTIVANFKQCVANL